MHTWHRECLNSGRQQKVKEVLETAISGFCGLKKKEAVPTHSTVRVPGNSPGSGVGIGPAQSPPRKVLGPRGSK